MQDPTEFIVGDRVRINNRVHHFSGYIGEVLYLLYPGMAPKDVMRKIGLRKKTGLYYADSYNPKCLCYLLRIFIMDNGEDREFFVSLPTSCLEKYTGPHEKAK